MITFLRLFLFPFAIVWFLITEFRNFLFSTRIMRGAQFDRPVICVGNLSTGGTGKTPMIEYLILLAKNNEMKPAVLSRGYGRKIPGFRMVNAKDKVMECGDDPLQIKQKFNDVPVAVCEKRVDGIIHLIKENKKNVELILLDDAYQHRAVKPSFSILTTSFHSPFFTDFMLPVGNLREMRRNSSRADVVVITKCMDGMTVNDFAFYRRSLARYSKAELFFSKIKYGQPQPVFESVTKNINLTQNVLLVTGIANAKPLVAHLSSICNCKHLSFGDHHHFTSDDMVKINENFGSFANGDKIILTTEKDAVRIRNGSEEVKTKLKNSPFYFIPMEMEIMDDDQNQRKEKFDQLILEHVRKFETND